MSQPCPRSLRVLHFGPAQALLYPSPRFQQSPYVGSDHGSSTRSGRRDAPKSFREQKQSLQYQPRAVSRIHAPALAGKYLPTRWAKPSRWLGNVALILWSFQRTDHRFSMAFVDFEDFKTLLEQRFHFGVVDAWDESVFDKVVNRLVVGQFV